MTNKPTRAFRPLWTAALMAAIIGLNLAATAPAQAQKYEWKLTSYVPVGSGTWNVYMKPFIDYAQELTDNQVKIKGFSVGVLASPFDAWKAVQKGTADICYCFTAFAANTDPTNAIFAGLAGGMSGEVFQHWLLEGDGGKLWREFRRDTTKQHPVITGFGPTEIFLHSHKKVQSIADLKGMKIRTTGAWADILKTLGASPTVLAPSDIYTSLERRVIDATEFITPATNVKLGYHKIAKYIIFPGIHQPTHANEAIWRISDWDKLPKDIRRKLTLAGELAGHKSYMALGLQDLDAMKTLRGGRNEWVKLDPTTNAKVTELARAWSAEQGKLQAAKGNMWTQKVADSYWKFYDKFQKYGDYRVQ